MENCTQRNSPDSSTNEDNKLSMTNNNHISGGAASPTEVTSRSSSKNLTVGYKCPKGCKTIFVDESTFAGHLLSEHNVKLVVTAPPSEHQQLLEGSQTNTASSPLSSLSSPSSTPPTMSSSSTTTTNVITKCPVCRLQVDDLPFHFATAHSTTNNKSPTNHDRSEASNNNNVLSNRQNHNLINGARSSNGEWTTSQLSPQKIPLVVMQNDSIKSEVLSYEEMESGMEENSLPPKSESPIKITNSASSSSSSVRKLGPPAKVMPIFLPSQPLPASQLTIEDASNISNPRVGEQSPWLQNKDVERQVRNLPMAIIPTVVGSHRPLASSLTLNGKTNSTEALNETDVKIPSHRGIGMSGQQLSVKVEEGGAMNLSIKDSPRSDMSKTNGAHVNGIPLPLLDGRAVNSAPTGALRSNAGLQYVLNTDSNVSSASLSDLESEGGQDNGLIAMNGAPQQHEDMSNEPSDKKRRRKQTQVPPGSKDQRYWARRLKNNEAAKRSRDMRIQREKIIFDENNRLESQVKELRSDQEKLTTENKELKLKMQFILEENARLQEIIRNIQVQQEQQQLDEEMDGHSKINGQHITTNGVHYK